MPGLLNTALKGLIVSAFTLGRKLLYSKAQRGQMEKEDAKDERLCEDRSQEEKIRGAPSDSQHQDPRQVTKAILVF